MSLSTKNERPFPRFGRVDVGESIVVTVEDFHSCDDYSIGAGATSIKIVSEVPGKETRTKLGQEKTHLDLKC